MDTALGKLISDFYCTEAKDMNYEELANRVRIYKETEEGVDSMCDVLDEMKKEAANKAEFNKACEIANRMIVDGTLSYEKIAELSGLSIDKVRELAGSKTA